METRLVKYYILELPIHALREAGLLFTAVTRCADQPVSTPTTFAPPLSRRKRDGFVGSSIYQHYVNTELRPKSWRRYRKQARPVFRQLT